MPRGRSLSFFLEPSRFFYCNSSSGGFRGSLFSLLNFSQDLVFPVFWSHHNFEFFTLKTCLSRSCPSSWVQWKTFVTHEVTENDFFQNKIVVGHTWSSLREGSTSKDINSILQKNHTKREEWTTDGKRRREKTITSDNINVWLRVLSQTE